MIALESLVRPNIWALQPYSSARDEYAGHQATVFLDANESPFNAPYNRYPDPLQHELKARIAPRKGVRTEQIFLGNGSDEAIDLVFRVFCEPRLDNVVAIAPTYGMYEVCAHTNDVAYRAVPLRQGYTLASEDLLAACDDRTKVIFICSPNNPTGNALETEAILQVLHGFEGIVVIDEAYADFSTIPSFRTRLQDFPNLIILNTFSKAWGSAGVRLGLAFASVEIINLFNKVKYPYNINTLTQEYALALLQDENAFDAWIKDTLQQRSAMIEAFQLLPFCQEVFPTDANFFLARVHHANEIYAYLVTQGIIVRNRSKIVCCQDTLRITIGTQAENKALLTALRNYANTYTSC